MAEKYCLFLLTSSGFPSKTLQENLISNNVLSNNFVILQVKPPHILYELRELKGDNLPMLMFGDLVVLSGDEEVMALMTKQAEIGSSPEEELEADFASRIMEKFLPVLAKFELPEEQELYDHSNNTIEDLLILILGTLLTQLPHMKEFLDANDIDIPDFPLEVDVDDEEDNGPHHVVDLDFDESIIGNFWQFALAPPKFPSREWVDFFYELYGLGLPISTLVKAVAWYFGRFAVRQSDLKILRQVQQIVPPSWGEFLELNINDDEISGGIQLNFYFTNPYGWDLMFFAFFVKGALETVKGMILKPFNIYYNAESKYFEFTGEFKEFGE